MTLLNPFTPWDLRFPLSSAATLGLILYVPLVHALFHKSLLWSRSPVFSTVWKLLGESIIVPAESGVIILGGIATVLGLVAVPLGQVAA